MKPNAMIIEKKHHSMCTHRTQCDKSKHTNTHAYKKYTHTHTNIYIHMAVCTIDRRRGLGQVQKIGMRCGATKMYLFRFFAKKTIKASHGRSKKQQ